MIMKKRTLLVLVMLMMFSLAEAKRGTINSKKATLYNGFNEAVSFVERGIQFHVSLYGDFNFDTYYNRGRRNQNTRIFRDYRGRITKIGTVFIHYDFRGNVRKIGTVKMKYWKNRLTNVGNLAINYNRWGDAVFYGQVKYANYYFDSSNYYNSNINLNFNLNIGTICLYNDPYFYRNEFRNNYRQFREDDQFFYYRANGVATTSRNKILKRRKPSRSVTNSTTTRKSTKVRKRNNIGRNTATTNNSRKKVETVRKKNAKRRVSKKPIVKKKTQVKKRVASKRRRN